MGDGGELEATELAWRAWNAGWRGRRGRWHGKKNRRGIGDKVEHGRVEGGKGCDSRGRRGPNDGGKGLARRLTTEERR